MDCFAHLLDMSENDGTDCRVYPQFRSDGRKRTQGILNLVNDGDGVFDVSLLGKTNDVTAGNLSVFARKA